MASMIDRYLAARERAVATGDPGLVRECDWNLQRLGYDPARPASAVQAEARADAEAQPAGRPTSRRAKTQAASSGGIVTRPTTVLTGEAGPEAIVPLGRGDDAA